MHVFLGVDLFGPLQVMFVTWFGQADTVKSCLRYLTLPGCFVTKGHEKKFKGG